MDWNEIDVLWNDATTTWRVNVLDDGTAQATNVALSGDITDPVLVHAKNVGALPSVIQRVLENREAGWDRVVKTPLTQRERKLVKVFGFQSGGLLAAVRFFTAQKLPYRVGAKNTIIVPLTGVGKEFVFEIGDVFKRSNAEAFVANIEHEAGNHETIGTTTDDTGKPVHVAPSDEDEDDAPSDPATGAGSGSGEGGTGTLVADEDDFDDIELGTFDDDDDDDDDDEIVEYDEDD